DSGLVVQNALADVPRVTDQPSGTAGQHDRAVPGLLETPQHQDRNEMPGVQARPGWIESGIESERPLIQVASQRVEISGLRDQSAPAQFIKDVLTHKASFPKTSGRSHPGSGATAATAPVGADRG